MFTASGLVVRFLRVEEKSGYHTVKVRIVFTSFVPQAFFFVWLVRFVFFLLLLLKISLMSLLIFFVCLYYGFCSGLDMLLWLDHTFIEYDYGNLCATVPYIPTDKKFVTLSRIC